MNEQEKRAFVKRIAEGFVPFNKWLALELTEFDPVKLRVENRQELVGNAVHNFLHGGIIASVLDVAGGIAIFQNLLSASEIGTPEEAAERFGRVGTVDIRIDYLRPGTGKEFIATGEIIRQGNRISVTRMELHNDQGQLVALGTGTYVC